MKKQFLTYLTSNYLSVILNVVRTIALAKLVLPEIVGVWSIINTFAGYFRYNNLGLNSLAYYRGNRKNAQKIYANLLLKTNVTLAIGLGAIYSLFFILTQYSGLNTGIDRGLLLLMFFSTIVGVQVSETYVSINKLNTNFRIISRNTNLFSVLQFGLVLIGALSANLVGILAGNTIAVVLSLVFLARLTRFDKYNVHVTLSRLFIFFKSAVSAIIPGFLYITFISLDVLLIKEKFGMAENGFYAIVLTLINIILIAPSSLAVFLYSKDPRRLINSKLYTIRATMTNFVVCWLLVILSYAFLHLLTTYFLKQYTRSLEIFSLLFFSIPFLSVKNVIVDILIAKSRHRLYNTILSAIICAKVLVLFYVSDGMFYSAMAGFNILFGLLTLLVYYFVMNEKKSRLKPVEYKLT